MKRILVAFAAAILVTGPLWAEASAAGGNSVMTKTGKVNVSALRDMLTKGLKATRTEEKCYIDYVVALVAQDALPVSYVYASFNYARKRRPDYPFPYFQYSLRALGKRKNIDL
jgi:hypothetical protein